MNEKKNKKEDWRLKIVVLDGAALDPGDLTWQGIDVWVRLCAMIERRSR